MNNSFAGAIQYVYYGKMKNNKIVSRYAKKLRIEYFIDKNSNGYPDEEERLKQPLYYYGNKRISKKKFNSYGVKGKYRMICGKVSYKTMKKKLIAKGA